MQIVIFTGIPGCGKSHFYHAFFFRTHMRINLDMLRTRSREWQFVQTCIQTKTKCVIDNTNVTTEHRRKYIDIAKAAGYRVEGYYFDVALEIAIQRNRLRPPAQVVPARGIQAMAKKLQIPTPEEGFDTLYRVQMPQAGSYVISFLHPHESCR
ncbi:MAG: AAA family ATPase [Chitinivibrionales bacterium]